MSEVEEEMDNNLKQAKLKAREIMTVLYTDYPLEETFAQTGFAADNQIWEFISFRLKCNKKDFPLGLLYNLIGNIGCRQHRSRLEKREHWNRQYRDSEGKILEKFFNYLGEDIRL